MFIFISLYGLELLKMCDCLVFSISIVVFAQIYYSPIFDFLLLGF